MSQKMRSQVENIKLLSEDQLSQVVGGTNYDYKPDKTYEYGIVGLPIPVPIIKIGLLPIPIPYIKKKVGYHH